MNAARLVLRGLLHRRRTNLAVALGAALAAAVLVGALGAGDSVRASLRRLTLQRLGGTVYALEAGERFFRAALAGQIADRLGGRGAALVAVRGSASARGGETRASPVQVLGVDPGFWRLGPHPGQEPQPTGLGEGEVLLNEALARRLGVGAGEEVLLRVHAPSFMPGGAPLSLGSGPAAALRLTVKGVVPPRGFGDFSLRVSQAPPLNAFVARAILAGRLQRAGRANTILLSSDRGLAEAERAFADSRRLEDAGLSLREAGSYWELASERVFLDPPVEAAAEKAAAGAADSPAASDPAAAGGVLTYFVDRISIAGRSLPYSFVSSAGAGRLGVELAGGEIALNAWAARELRAGPGDAVELEYRVPVAGDRLERRNRLFRVRLVVPIQPEDRTLMPAFPGLAGAENCRDWDPGVPIDLNLIADREERYWDDYRGSPKAFISPSEAQGLWGNRFGRLTAFRFPPGVAQEALAARILENLDPRSLGLGFLPVRESGLEASAASVDFGELFLGLSFFLVAAALLLTGLLFQLSVEQRRADAGTLAALGFTRARILRLLLAEGALVALAGSAAGLPLGLAFHRGVLAGLGGVWRDAVRTPLLVPFVSPAALLAGFCGGLGASLAVIAAAGIRLLSASPGRNLRGRPPRTRGGWAAAAVAAGCALAAGLVLPLVSAPVGFFAAGALLLAAFLAASLAVLARLDRPRRCGLPTIGGLGLANAARRRGRSLTVASLLACGIFVVAAVAANRRGLPDPAAKSSGTGGFAFIAETAVALERDPAGPEGRAALRLPELDQASFVGFRVLEGDDASCLNLNRVRQPRILAVAPSRLTGSFSFSARRDEPADPWGLLELDLGPDTIPAIADQTVITYGLGLEVGRELEYRDERGRPLRVRLMAGLANSIFQGHLIVAERALLRHFPSAGGYRFLLVACPPDRRAEVESGLNRALERYGAAVAGAAERLAEFNSVENTYLAIFGLLGWLGLLVGTLGLAIAVARNVAEMRGELALLRAVGWGRAGLLRLVLAEHLPPLGFGLAAGAAASALAVYPAACLRGSGLPFAYLLLLAGSIAASALIFTVIAAGLALRADLLPALRNE